MNYEVVLSTRGFAGPVTGIPYMHVGNQLDGNIKVYTIPAISEEHAYELTENMWKDLGVAAIDSIQVLETRVMSSAEFAERFVKKPTWRVTAEGKNRIIRALSQIMEDLDTGVDVALGDDGDDDAIGSVSVDFVGERPIDFCNALLALRLKVQCKEVKE